jgi:hypothetical protein
MKISVNNTFKKLLEEYWLPEDLNFKIVLTKEIEKILSSKILYDAKGVGLEYSGKCSSDNSYDEDLQNHFHVDGYIKNSKEPSKDAFVLGIKTLMELAKRFEREKLNNIQFSYSFQSPEMVKVWCRENGIKDDDHYTSDRLSFHKKREGQVVVNDSLFNDKHWAFLLIDL